MRQAATVVALCLARLAFTAPIPVIIVQGGRLETVAGAAHPPAPIADPISRISPALTEADDAPSNAAGNIIDNRPQTPPPSANPSAVLSTVRPVETAYLLSLAMPAPAPATSGPVLQIQRTQAIIRLKAAARFFRGAAAAHPEGPTVVRVNLAVEGYGPAGGRRPFSPCAYAHLSREYHDMLVITLVVAFLLVVIAVELWESMRSNLRRMFSRQGAIRLETEAVEVRRAISVQAQPPDLECLDEKSQA